MKKQENLILLAPMEGVMDALMRDLITGINCYDLCMTEFIRVVDRKVPNHTFFKLCPELHNNGYTSNQTPVRLQLLGQDPNWMAENAVKAIELGSHGIDINFGCPAKTVNKSRGGAVLLKSPELIYEIVSSVKKAVGSCVQVSAKIRLGYEDTELFKDNVAAIEAANAHMLTIHARTKQQGYRPPAHWQMIAEVVDSTDITMVANGEIWTLEDAMFCKSVARVNNIMLGRGALATPNLSNVIKGSENPYDWQQMSELLIKYSELELLGDKSFYFSSRIKQWLRYLKLQYIEAENLFKEIKTLKDKSEILRKIHQLNN